MDDTRAPLAPEQVLAMIPHQPPFRFLDELLELDEAHAVGRYTFPPEAAFYQGHFPGNPVTPGVILIETLCQTGLVALGIYLGALAGGDPGGIVTVLTNVEAEFTGVVRPGETVTVRAEKVYWRMRKLRARAEMRNAAGIVVCAGELAGMAVPATALEGAG